MTSETSDTDLDNIYINKVLNNAHLKTAISRLIEPGVINLITPNWRDVLYNNRVYLNHKEGRVSFSNPNMQTATNQHIKKYGIIDRENKFQVLVVGLFRVFKNEQGGHLLVQDHCSPLSEIGKVMCPDEKITFCSNCKYYMMSCNGICPSCRHPDSKDCIPQDNIWCASETKVFTLKGLERATREYCAAVFRNSTIVIMRMEINMKYYFSHCSKIGGLIKSMIFVQENLLREKEEITGFLSLSNNFVPETFTMIDEMENNNNDDEGILACPTGVTPKREREIEATFEIEFAIFRFVW